MCCVSLTHRESGWWIFLQRTLDWRARAAPSGEMPWQDGVDPQDELVELRHVLAQELTVDAALSEIRASDPSDPQGIIMHP